MYSTKTFLRFFSLTFGAGLFLAIIRPAIAQEASAPLPQTAPIYILLDSKAKQCRWYGGNTDLSEVPSNWKSYQVSDGSGKNNTVDLPGGTCDFSRTDIQSCCENIGYTYNSETNFVKKENTKAESIVSSKTVIVLGLGLLVGAGAAFFWLRVKKKPYEPAP